MNNKTCDKARREANDHIVRSKSTTALSFKRWRCITCPLFRRSDWHVLNGDEVAILEEAHQRREYRTGERIFSTGEANQGVYCVSGGTVGVRKIDDEGNSVLVHLAYPGDMLGYRSFLARAEHETTTEALSSCVICFFGSKTVSEVLARNCDLGLQFLKRANNELGKAYDTILESSTFSNRARLAHLLLNMIQRHGETTADGRQRICLPVSRRDLASMIGTRYETLSRIIRRLEDDGVATFSGRHVDIPKLDALIKEIPRSSSD